MLNSWPTQASLVLSGPSHLMHAHRIRIWGKKVELCMACARAFLMQKAQAKQTQSRVMQRSSIRICMECMMRGGGAQLPVSRQLVVQPLISEKTFATCKLGRALAWHAAYKPTADDSESFLHMFAQNLFYPSSYRRNLKIHCLPLTSP